MINKNNEYVIKKEVIDIKKDSDIYLKQLFLSDNNVAAEDFFQKQGKQVVEELSYKIGDRVVLYSKSGDYILDSSENTKSINGSKKDLTLAKNNKIAYAINYNKEKVTVNFSYPVVIDNKEVGIVRYIVDYSDLYKSGNKLINMIKIFSLILFLAILIISLIISKGITVPISKLNNLIKKVSEGSLEIEDDIKSKDEVGELYNNFCVMTERIKMQIDKIERDSAAIKELENHRKIFFDNVTHELKTPLTTILGYSEIIKSNGFNTDEEFFNKGMNYIISESERLRRMVINLLECSQIQIEGTEENFKPINISEIINSTCEEMEIKANRYNIKINKEVAEDIFILGNQDKLKQVLINIIDNSIKYGFENSGIEVITVKEGTNVKTTIVDFGEGISEDKLDSIFNPFYRANDSNFFEKGSKGLGLSISKTIIDKHKGNISVESKFNEGTVVTIKLPLL